MHKGTFGNRSIVDKTEPTVDLAGLSRPHAIIRAGKGTAKSFYIQTRRLGQTVMLIDGMPGRKSWVGDLVRFEPSHANVEYLLEFFETTPDCDRSAALFATVQAEIDGRSALAVATLEEAAESVMGFNFKHPPYRHQAAALGLSKDREAFGLLLDTGTGKTKVSIDTAAYLWRGKKIDLMVIIAPKGVHEQWVHEQLIEHMPDDIEYQATVLNLSKKFPADIYSPSKKLRIIAINIDAVGHQRGYDAVQRLLKSGRALLILDESSRIKTPSAKRTVAVTALGRLAKYRRILTGTPVTQGLQDLYSQFRFLDENILGHATFTSFRRKYCRMGGYENRQIIGYYNIDDLNERVAGHSLQVHKDDCLDLPPKTYMRRFVDLTDEQRKLFDKIKKDYFALLDSGEVLDANHHLTRLLMLQQITCGHYREPESRDVQELKSNRIEAVKEILAETDEKAIVWSRFVPDILRLQTALPNFVTYYGGMSGKQRTEALDRLKNDPECRGLIGQQDSGGIGLNMTSASLMIYFSNNFNAETRWQSEARVYRMGQQRKVTYIDLYTPGTPDAVILHALNRKADVAGFVEDRDLIKQLLGGK